MPRRSVRVVKLKPGTVSDDTQFIETLVWALARARQGKIRGYAFVFTAEGEEKRQLIGAACAAPDDAGSKADEATELLGAIRRMELDYIKRTWGE